MIQKKLFPLLLILSLIYTQSSFGMENARPCLRGSWLAIRVIFHLAEIGIAVTPPIMAYLLYHMSIEDLGEEITDDVIKIVEGIKPLMQKLSPLIITEGLSSLLLFGHGIKGLVDTGKGIFCPSHKYDTLN